MAKANVEVNVVGLEETKELINNMATLVGKLDSEKVQVEGKTFSELNKEMIERIDAINTKLNIEGEQK